MTDASVMNGKIQSSVVNVIPTGGSFYRTVTIGFDEGAAAAGTVLVEFFMPGLQDPKTLDDENTYTVGTETVLQIPTDTGISGVRLTPDSVDEEMDYSVVFSGLMA